MSSPVLLYIVFHIHCQVVTEQLLCPRQGSKHWEEWPMRQTRSFLLWSLHSGWGWVAHIKIMEKQAKPLVIRYEVNKWVGEAMPVADEEHNDRQVGKEGHSEDVWPEAPKDRKPLPIRDSKCPGQWDRQQEQGGGAQAERRGGAEWAGPRKSQEGVWTSF